MSHFVGLLGSEAPVAEDAIQCLLVTIISFLQFCVNFLHDLFDVSLF